MHARHDCKGGITKSWRNSIKSAKSDVEVTDDFYFLCIFLVFNREGILSAWQTLCWTFRYRYKIFSPTAYGVAAIITVLHMLYQWWWTLHSHSVRLVQAWERFAGKMVCPPTWCLLWRDVPRNGLKPGNAFYLLSVCPRWETKQKQTKTKTRIYFQIFHPLQYFKRSYRGQQEPWKIYLWFISGEKKKKNALTALTIKV